MQQDESAHTVNPALNSSLCLYPSKRCENPRAIKSNGQLHKFCQ
ncbi:hypothetical protein PC116_g27049 [Phytophthora cactorum]|uniref:Uncharacterized protein n=1 Tax=Phytophthora cactorum TaxID=29920 RepID=A0A8T1JR40_9STRA|nr:hypothetical protein Pcac1_g13016 [Phytophthora cactorum]KAG2878665.1 hypothetical protein PC117_g26901 [Phytophthora cactorum]KAG3126560.1 hypothetical protein C6341_g25319 [Phytophthora cactorum]KAG3140691.1 hypothetical protein PC128_g25138 [Phytophthora cactorum]KAG4224501.1 hypothetical protein PC116_g27049 [Phytophthora cactorum]